MTNTYTVELRFAPGTIGVEAVTKHVCAEDGYEAVALARQLVALQNPEVDLALIDGWCLKRHLGASA